MRERIKLKKFLVVLVILIDLLIIVVLINFWQNKKIKESDKMVLNMTWEEFEGLSEVEQMKFIDSFGDDFEQWMNSVRTIEEVLPWEIKGAKKVEEYTWEEFEDLDQIHQEIFIDSFDGEISFEEWLKTEKKEETFIFSGNKNYTWEEFQAMDKEQQEQFINSFTEDGSFEDWLEKENPNSNEIEVPWDESDAKQPEEYTWEEFESLTETQQMVFVDLLDNIGSFEAWLNANKPE